MAAGPSPRPGSGTCRGAPRPTPSAHDTSRGRGPDRTNTERAPSAPPGPLRGTTPGTLTSLQRVLLRRQRRDQRVVLLDDAHLRRAAGRSELVEELDVGVVVLRPLVGGVVLVEDRLDRADRLAGAAVHALVRLDVEHPAALVDAVDGALVDAGAVLHVDAGQGDHVGHRMRSSQERWCGAGSSRGAASTVGSQVHLRSRWRERMRMNAPHEPEELMTIGEMGRRTGVAASALRYYEDLGLIASVRTAGNQRRYARHMLRRVSLVSVAKRLGIPLADVGAAFGDVPMDRTPSHAEWQRASRRWRRTLEER